MTTKKILKGLLMAVIMGACTISGTLIAGVCVYFIVLTNFKYDLLNKESTIGKMRVNEAQMVVFPGLKGPQASSFKPPFKTTSWRNYASLNDHTFAVFLSDTNSNFLGLVHAFKTFGMPISLHTNLREAMQHKIVYVYPNLSEESISPEQIEQVKKYVLEGGTLIGSNVKGQMKTFFGLKYNTLALSRYGAILSGSDPLFNIFKFPEERRLSFGNKKDYPEIFETYGYTTTTAKTLIQFEDSSALLTFEKQGKGAVYAMGIDCGEFFLRCQNSRSFNAGRTYVNGFEPTMDVLMRVFKQIYFNKEDLPVTLGTVPYNKFCTILLSHDIDYTLSIENAVGYAAMEQRKGVKATYFIQTKYITDWNDHSFFNPKGILCLKKIAAAKMEIASHSVSHSRSFSSFEWGSGTEQYPYYRPFVKEKTNTFNGTILGELRVSKFLLEYFLPGTHVSSFRAGHLSNPSSLPEALHACKFLNSSNETANNSLTHLPFQLNFNRCFSQELPIFEYPVTIEDEAAPGLGKRLEKSKEVIDKIGSYGGLVCILIHTDTFGEKFKFEEAIIDHYQQKAHFSTIKDFNTWWVIRNKVKIHISKTGSSIHLLLSTQKQIEGLCLEIPSHWRLLRKQPGMKQIGNKIILEKLIENQTIHFFELPKKQGPI